MIGVASSPTLDPDASNYGWTDQGMVIRSRSSNRARILSAGPDELERWRIVLEEQRLVRDAAAPAPCR